MNNNVLEGIRCPECQSEGPFSITVTTTITVRDDGVDNDGDNEWTDESPIMCHECGHQGRVKGFSFEGDL
jgi:hypothetical protein